MLLDQVTLSRFKSYSGNVVVKFQPGSTLFVGRNSSGKSNLFQAIEFVLGSRHSRILHEDRSRFINNYEVGKELRIELILKDEQFGTVKIRRELSCSRDSYFLNDQPVKKVDLRDYLGLMGLPINVGPFFIVKHSLLKGLVISTPKTRLNSFISNLGLLEARAFSTLGELAILLSGEKEQLLYAITRFKPISMTAELLAQYRRYKTVQTKESKIVAQLHLSKIRELKKKIYEVTASIGKANEVSSYTMKLTETKMSLDQAREDLKLLKGFLITLNDKKSNLLDDIEKTLSVLRECEKYIGDYHCGASGLPVSRPQKRSELERRYEETLERLESEQSVVDNGLRKPNHEVEQQRSNRIYQIVCSVKLQTVHDKKLWIGDELGRLTDKIENNVKKITKLDSQIQDTARLISSCEREIKDFESYHVQSLISQESTLIHQMNTLQKELNDLLQKESSLLKESENQMMMLKSERDKMMKLGADWFKGYENVDNVLTSLQHSEQGREILNRCVGIVMDNFKCDPALNPAISATVGPRLFVQIVDDVTVGTYIAQEMHRQRLPGKVQLLALNSGATQRSPIESSSDPEAPLLEKLHYPSQFREVMTMIFGKIRVSRDSGVAAHSSSTCFTLHGSEPGELSGGSGNGGLNLLSCYAAYKPIKVKHQKTTFFLMETKKQTIIKKSSIESVSFKLQQTTKLIASDHQFRRINLEQTIKNLKMTMKLAREELGTVVLEQTNLISRQQILLQMDQEGLSEDSPQTVLTKFGRLGEDVMVETFEEKIKALATTKNTVGRLEADLAASKDSDTKVEKAKADMPQSEREEHKAKIDFLNSQLATVEEKMKTTIVQFTATFHKVGELEGMVEQIVNESAEIEARNIMVSKKMLANYEEHLLALQKEVKKIKKNCDGPLRSNTRQPEQELQDQLASVHEEMAEFGTHPWSAREVEELQKNMETRQLLEKTLKITTRHEQLVNRFDTWVKKHVTSLLKEIFRNFSYFFGLFVKKGQGSLSFSRSSDRHSIDGIVLDVDFDGTGPIRDASMLSTGQQSVVLLSIVFSFLKTQSVNFCLMDEIDRNLSPQYVMGLARAMQEFGADQFLISSHDMMMVESCQQYFGVESSSRIWEIEQAEAREKMELYQCEGQRPSQTLSHETSQFSFDSNGLSGTRRLAPL